jgi:hypothetical protein
VKLILDAGALIGIDRNGRRGAGLIELGRRTDAELVTTTPIVAQAWRDGTRQARLSRALPMIDVRHVHLDVGWQAGELLALSGTADVVDALLALTAMPGDEVLTSGPADLDVLLGARRTRAIIVQM